MMKVVWEEGYKYSEYLSDYRESIFENVVSGSWVHYSAVRRDETVSNNVTVH